MAMARTAARREGRRHGTSLAFGLVAAVALGLGVGMLVPQRDGLPAGPTEVSAYTVRPGDTLWGYAERITPAGHDVSRTVQELVDLNHLRGPELNAGKRILVQVRG